MSIETTEELRALVADGVRLKYLHFWGHTGEGIGPHVLSQWYPATFELEGVTYPTAEHWMMAEKARLFQDRAALKAILDAEHPGEAKRIGREVRGFDREVWEFARVEVVVGGSLAKFGQNPELQDYLLSTGDKVLVEASPVDEIWGIGWPADAPEAHDPAKWRGDNLLGFALMRARKQLAQR